MELVDRELNALKEVIKQKNHDYTGGDDNPFANFEDTGGLASPLAGVLLRMGDKMQRLRAFAKKGKLEVVGEGAKDAALDMIGYSLIVIGLLEKETTKPQSNKRELTLEVGKRYLRRDGHVVTIVEKTIGDDEMPFNSSAGYWYNRQGIAPGAGTAMDLIKEVD